MNNALEQLETALLDLERHTEDTACVVRDMVAAIDLLEIATRATLHVEVIEDV